MVKKANRAALVCPRCTLYWCDIQYRYGKKMNAGDVIVHVGKKLNNGDELVCPGCEHKHTNYDIYIAIAEPRKWLIPGEKVMKDNPAVEDEVGAAGREDAN